MPWPDAARLEAFNRWMAGLGPRFTGTPAHDCLLHQIRQALAPLVPNVLEEQLIPRRFTNWEATTWTVDVGGGAVPAAGYMPFSGLTGPGGVSGEVVFERPGFFRRLLPFLSLLGPIEMKDRHEDKIVAVWIPSVAFPKCLLKYLSRGRHTDLGNWFPYRRTIALENQAPCPNRAALVGKDGRGAKGIIAILDMPPEEAEKQYLPFSRPVGAEPVPAVHVDRSFRSVLKELARDGTQAKITLDGNTGCDETHHLVYTLPGRDADTEDDSIILIQTHTDGPSAVEENGVMALIALAHRFAALPIEERAFTLKLLFATGHFVKEIEGAADVVHRGCAPWLARTRASVAIEHLGTKEWVEDPAGTCAVRQSGGAQLDEPALLFVTQGKNGSAHPLERHAWATLPSDRLVTMPSRRRMKARLKRRFFGEGQYIACAGIPTVGYVPNPNYIFSFADPGGPLLQGHVEKLDAQRMEEELDGFWKLTSDLVADRIADWPSSSFDPGACSDPKKVPETVCD
jgi:hypothetical protein